MIIEELEQPLRMFAKGNTMFEVWEGARVVMGHKQRGQIADHPLLFEGLERLGQRVSEGSDTSRLMAVDLLVRMPAAVKKAASSARSVRSDVLNRTLPLLSSLSSAEIPENAELAEIRENVAIALKEATGSWVLPYVFTALINEERSQRCRIALAEVLASRSSHIDEWFIGLVDSARRYSSSEDKTAAAAVLRLRDLALALVDAVYRHRSNLSVTPKAGGLLTDLMKSLLPLSRALELPDRLEEACAAIAKLLDEILAVRLTLMDEPQLYEPIELMHRWWVKQRIPAILTEALSPISEKIVAGIIFRARAGQRSQELLSRLNQSIGDAKNAKVRMTKIVESEPSLPPDIQDWLLGITRSEPLETNGGVQLLNAVSEESFIKSLAPIFLLASDYEDSSSASGNEYGVLAQMIFALGQKYGLEKLGSVGDLVEYLPSAHDTASNSSPRERRVRLVRPSVVRQRIGGGSDVVMRGLVEDIDNV